MCRLPALAALACLSLAGAASADPLDNAMQLARRTLAFVERSAARPQFAAELAVLEKRLADARSLQDADRRAVYAEIRQLRRRIILSHPLLDFDKLLINKRTGQLPEHMCDQYLGRHSRPGPGLVVLESWKDSPRETPLLAGRLPVGGTLHPDLSFDGKRVLFAFCDDTTKSSNLRGYFIYEAALDGSSLRQLTGTPADPMIGANGRQTVLIEDFDPCYLPDGGFAFISTRSQQFGRCHGGRYVPSYTLHRADADGSNIHPLSFNEANEWGPSVLPDGLIVYTRWDYINRHDTIFQSLWVTRPDGTAVGHYYGNYSRSPCMIAEAKAIPGSHKVVATACAHHGQTLGSIIVVDPYKGQDDGLPLTAVTPEFPFPEASIPKGTTMAARPLPEEVAQPQPQPEPQAKGKKESRRENRAATPFPLSEDLFLAAYPHGSELAIYLIDTLGGRELIYADPRISCFDPIPIRPRPRPPVLASAIAGHEHESTGRFFIQDVYQSTAPIERGTVRRLRINEIISQPTSSFPPRSRAENEVVKRILGTVAVADDGSVAFEAPACALLQFQLLDQNGMAVMTMRSGVYLQPGEQASCVGCHERRSSSPVPPTRLAGVNFQRIEPPVGPRYDGGFSFARTVQPVLDRYCIACHGLDRTVATSGSLVEASASGPLAATRDGSLSLLGTPEDSKQGRFSVSYDSLVSRKGLVAIAHRNSETAMSKPKDYFAHAGRLAKLLLDGHPVGAPLRGRPQECGHIGAPLLDRESFQRIADWLDLNAQFYGDYSFNRAESRQPSPDGEKALRECIEKRFGAELARQPYAALVNVALPTESRILKAPLAKEAGGWGQIAQGGWSSADDPAYKEMLARVEASITPLNRMDIAGTCGGDGRGGCRCGCCWVRQARQKLAARPQPRTVDGLPVMR